MSKVSFILPAYKGAFLERSIRSILAQTYRDYELIVVDDCSPEDIKTIVDQFFDARICYRRNKTNLGGEDLIAAWKHAMSFAKGEWCVLAGDDDYYAPTFLEELISLSKKYPKSDLIHARQVVVDKDDNWLVMARPHTEYESQIEFAYTRAIWKFEQAAPDFMFRLEAYRRIGGFVNFPMAWYSDDATWMLLARNGVANTRKPLFFFRHSGINISTRKDFIIPKVRAAEAFKKWALNALVDFTAKSPEEKFLLQSLKSNLPASVNVTTRRELKNASLLTWCRCLNMVTGSRREKLHMIVDRFPFLAMFIGIGRKINKLIGAID